MKIPTVLPFAFSLIFTLACQRPSETEFPGNLHPSSPEVLNSGFRRETTIEAAEKAHTITDPRLGERGVVFGFMNKEWQEFKVNFQVGDQLIEFYTPPAVEEMIHGYGGFEIIRNGKVVATLITIT